MPTPSVVVRAGIARAARRPLRGRGRGRGGRRRPRDPRRRRRSPATRWRSTSTGTAPQYRGNLNCPLAVTRSACFFVVRAASRSPDIPASGGAFVPVTVRAPEGSLVNARSPAAVVAGNTETSSRITDVVMAAFGQAVDVPAQGQGTMNNTTFGTEHVDVLRDDRRRPGREPARRRPSAVHVAMSNALNTPVEALELAYPLRVERYALRSARAARAPSGRRRCRPRDSRARAVPAVGARRPAPPCARRRARRRAGRARPHARERRGDPRQGHAPARGGRRRAHRDAGRRRLRPA